SGVMTQENSYREKANAEVHTWIDLKKRGDLQDKFWYINSVRRDADGSWHVNLGEEQIFYSATRLSEKEGESQPERSPEAPNPEEILFDDLGERCEAVLDEVKRAISEYLTSTGEGRVKSWRISVGESTYRILIGDRLEAWQRDPRRFLAEYTLIESGLRETTCEQDASRSDLNAT
ncbi:MAG: hypothetical protein ABIH23_16680, partial [bacterium]